MEIREANEIEIPQIVEVLKASLGEDQLKLSEEIWRYKHIDNPFGKSIVLVAVENGEILGVRAFMRWQWQQGAKRFSALRAVDTATHPDHQGKGIFKKLTLKAVDIAKFNSDNFIFNTPNEKSKPGYLKMGWVEVGKIHVGLRPSLSFLRFHKNNRTYNTTKYISQNDLDELCRTWNENLIEKKRLFTPKSAEMLRWRYEENPLQSYEVIAGMGYYLAVYLKKRGRLKELRLAEFIYNENKLSKRQLKKVIQKVVTQFSCHIISFSPNLLGLTGEKGNFGPTLTFNALNIGNQENAFLLNISNWNNSLGDLELF